MKARRPNYLTTVSLLRHFRQSTLKYTRSTDIKVATQEIGWNRTTRVVKLLKDIMVNTRVNKRRQTNRRIKAKGRTVKVGRPHKRHVLPDDIHLAGTPHAVLAVTAAIPLTPLTATAVPVRAISRWVRSYQLTSRPRQRGKLHPDWKNQKRKQPEKQVPRAKVPSQFRISLILAVCKYHPPTLQAPLPSTARSTLLFVFMALPRR